MQTFNYCKIPRPISSPISVSSQIKFLMTKKGIAMVEMRDNRGADNVLRYLNRAKALGSQLSVSVSKVNVGLYLLREK